MQGRLASITAAITVLILLILFFVSAPTSWTLQRPSQPVLGFGPYTGWPDPQPWHPPSPKEASGGNTAERLIIKVKLENEDASWTQHLAPQWQNNTISIDSMYSHTHPEAHRSDKGRVASAYLTWIVENYNNLPETLVFIPPADKFESNTLNLPDVMNSIQVPFIQQSGFVNIRCPSEKSSTTCNDKVLVPANPSYELRTLEAKMPKVWEALFGNTMELPQQIATVLGAEFAVSKAQVQKRSVEDYLKYWTWLNRTIMDDDSSGLVFEYLWHIIFGKDAVFCPERIRCECDLYRKCDRRLVSF
jgi:hypothetical protein